MVMERTTLGRNVQPLERDGLIRIETAPSDRRAKELHLTKAGEQRLQAGLKAWANAQARFAAGFGNKRAAELRTLLTQSLPASSRRRRSSKTGKSACCTRGGVGQHGS